MSPRRVLLACAAAFALGACEDIGSGPPPAPPPVPVRHADDPRPLRVLFVGNSLTFFNDLPGRVADIAVRDTALRYPDMQSVVRGGAWLQLHWANGTAQQRLTQERWDYLVLQEGSLPILERPESTEAVVQRFDSLARRAGARTVLYLTWTYGDTPQYQDSVSRVYVRIAQRVGTLVAPVGIAWQRSLAQDQSLPLYLPDLIHPSPVGTYLAACTMFAALYRRTPVGLATSVAVGDTVTVPLDSGVAALLQSTAWTVTLPFLPR